ncbi:hypothetical protein DFH09DRAFT_379296 [Mycena vulgaris]|nr:hypothetical protein DFH09DRAFT_379296 [Mycena vulgaris]
MNPPCGCAVRGGKEGARKAHVQDQRGQSWRTWKRVTRDPGRSGKDPEGIGCLPPPLANPRRTRTQLPFPFTPQAVWCARLRAPAPIRRSPRAALLLPPFPSVARPHLPPSSVTREWTPVHDAPAPTRTQPSHSTSPPAPAPPSSHRPLPARQHTLLISTHFSSSFSLPYCTRISPPILPSPPVRLRGPRTQADPYTMALCSSGEGGESSRRRRDWGGRGEYWRRGRKRGRRRGSCMRKEARALSRTQSRDGAISERAHRHHVPSPVPLLASYVIPLPASVVSPPALADAPSRFRVPSSLRIARACNPPPTSHLPIPHPHALFLDTCSSLLLLLHNGLPLPTHLSPSAGGRLRVRRGLWPTRRRILDAAQQAGSKRTVGWAKTGTGGTGARGAGGELLRVRHRPHRRRGIWDGAYTKRRGNGDVGWGWD